MQVLCKSEWFAGLAFGAASPFAGFACGLDFVTLRAEDLKVCVLVVVGATAIVNVVDFQVFGVATLSTLVTVTRQYSLACGGGDVGFGVCPDHCLFLCFVSCSSRENDVNTPRPWWRWGVWCLVHPVVFPSVRVVGLR